MAEQQQQYGPGGHYSGHNPIPTVKQFVRNLDKDKKSRDQKLDEEAALNKEAQKQAKNAKGEAQPHKAAERQVKGTEKTVTDPTTGKQVVISDVNKDMMKEVENPHLVVPNANLNKDTVCNNQFGHYYCSTNAHSPSKLILLSPLKITSTIRMSQLPQIQSPQALHPTYPFTVKRRTFYSIQHRLSVMSLHSKGWSSALPFCLPGYSSQPLLSARCLEAHSRASYHLACACHPECSCG